MVVFVCLWNVWNVVFLWSCWGDVMGGDCGSGGRILGLGVHWNQLVTSVKLLLFGIWVVLFISWHTPSLLSRVVVRQESVSCNQWRTVAGTSMMVGVEQMAATLDIRRLELKWTLNLTVLLFIGHLHFSFSDDPKNCKTSLFVREFRFTVNNSRKSYK